MKRNWLPRLTVRSNDGTTRESVVGGFLLAPLLVPVGLGLTALGKKVETFAYEFEADARLHKEGKCRAQCHICHQKNAGKVVTITWPDGTKEQL